MSRHSCIGSSCGGMKVWQAPHSRSASTLAPPGTYCMLAAPVAPSASRAASTSRVGTRNFITASQARKIADDVALLGRRAFPAQHGLAVSQEPFFDLFRIGETVRGLGYGHGRDGLQGPGHALG